MRKSIIFVVLLLSITLIISGCSSESDNPELDNVENEAIDNVEESEDLEDDLEDEETVLEEIEEEAEEEDTENSIKDIFSKIDNIDDYYYEVDSTIVDGPATTTKIMVSNNKMRMESYLAETDETFIMIVDGDEEVSYMYMPKDNTAIKMKYDNSDLIENPDSQDYVELMKDLGDNEDVNVENGTFNGESVKIITGEIMGNTNKIWVSNKTGFPLKSEFYEDGQLTITSLMKNFEEKSIDSSLFKIPEGVEIMDLTEGIEGIPD